MKASDSERPDPPERLSLFQKIADRVSYAMGTPTNIIIWLLAVGTWIAFAYPGQSRLQVSF